VKFHENWCLIMLVLLEEMQLILGWTERRRRGGGIILEFCRFLTSQVGLQVYKRVSHVH
jgi:hypothetical protein